VAFRQPRAAKTPLNRRRDRCRRVRRPGISSRSGTFFADHGPRRHRGTENSFFSVPFCSTRRQLERRGGPSGPPSHYNGRTGRPSRRPRGIGQPPFFTTAISLRIGSSVSGSGDAMVLTFGRLPFSPKLAKEMADGSQSAPP